MTEAAVLCCAVLCCAMLCYAVQPVLQASSSLLTHWNVWTAQRATGRVCCCVLWRDALTEKKFMLAVARHSVPSGIGRLVLKLDPSRHHLHQEHAEVV
jgi:hypothetical protein